MTVQHQQLSPYRRTGYDVQAGKKTFDDICRDILVALTELPNSRTDRPMPRGSLGGEVIYSLSRDERRLASMMATLDRRHDRRRHRATTLLLQGWLQDRLRLRREVFRGTQ